MMSKHADLAKRLRIMAHMISMGEGISFGRDSAIMNEAAADIEAMEKRITELRVALKPYADLANEYDCFRYGVHPDGRIARLRRARAAYLGENNSKDTTKLDG